MKMIVMGSYSTRRDKTNKLFNSAKYCTASSLTMTNALEAARGNLTTFFCRPKGSLSLFLMQFKL